MGFIGKITADVCFLSPIDSSPLPHYNDEIIVVNEMI